MAISTVIITVVELITGLIVNIGLKLDVWDYSKYPYNFMGQICVRYTIIWFLISPLAIILDDYIRYYFMGKKNPVTKYSEDCPF